MDIKLKATDWNIDAAKYGVKAGDCVILEGGSRAEIEFHNLIGTADKPITVTALDKVLIKGINPGGRVVTFYNCKYLRFTGGDNRAIEITGGAQAVDFREFSTDLEIDHLYIHDVGYLGIAAKTDVNANDPRTFRDAFVMRNVHIHDNIVDGTKDGEGIYTGLSHFHSDAREHSSENVVIENNVFQNIGADGIQVGGCIKGCIIRNNTIINAGTNKVFGQASGIQINPGTSALVEDNIIDGCTNIALSIQGKSSTIVRRNRIKNTVGGVFAVARETGDTGTFQIYNNTFVDVSGPGVDYYSPVSFVNNVLQVTVGNALYKQGGSAGKLTKTGNTEVTGTSTSLKLDSDLVPTAESLIPAGVGYKDYVKPVPKTVVEDGSIIVETTGSVTEIFVTTPSGRRIPLK